MAFSSTTQYSDDITWNSLKRAIASSSGFQRWCVERGLAGTQGTTTEAGMEQMVSRYLRETLETLAY